MFVPLETSVGPFLMTLIAGKDIYKMLTVEEINLLEEKMRNGMREMAETCSVLKKQCDCSIFCAFYL